MDSVAANIIHIDGAALDVGNVSRLNASASGADTELKPHGSAVSQTKSDKQSGEERAGCLQILKRFGGSALRLAKQFPWYERLPTAEANAAPPVFEDWVTKNGVDSLLSRKYYENDEHLLKRGLYKQG
uniref:Uncharacterized protein n=1 Tax=Peronospora matthiolae TaxID=2874970 RepID=A0AAV1TLQ7_9STRA